jgi:hypothetical protein
MSSHAYSGAGATLKKRMDFAFLAPVCSKHLDRFCAYDRPRGSRLGLGRIERKGGPDIANHRNSSDMGSSWSPGVGEREEILPSREEYPLKFDQSSARTTTEDNRLYRKRILANLKWELDKMSPTKSMGVSENSQRLQADRTLPYPRRTSAASVMATSDSFRLASTVNHKPPVTAPSRITTIDDTSAFTNSDKLIHDKSSFPAKGQLSSGRAVCKEKC